VSLRILSRDVAFYGALDFLQRSLSIVLVPIYTRVLTQSDYGNLDLIFTVWSALTVLVDLQFIAGFSRLYLERQRIGDGPRFVGTAILTRLVIGVVLAVLFLSLGYGGFLELRFIPSFLQHRTAWTLVVLSIPVALTYDVVLVQAQLLRRKMWFFAGAFGNTLISTILCVVFTVFVPLGIVGVVLGQVVGTFAGTCILFAGLGREISFRYHAQLLREISRYSLPIVPGRWLSHFSAYVSRFFIYAGLGAGENAILAITTKLAAVVGLFCLAFRMAWQPLAMSYIGTEKAESFYVRSLRIFMAGGLFSVSILILLAKPILAILAPGSYVAAEYYVPFFLVAIIIGELDVNLQLGNQISKKTQWLSVASGLAFAINILILMTLTSRLGIYAAAIGLLLAFLAKVTITYLTGQRNYKIPYDKRSLLGFFFGCIALLILSVARSRGLLTDVAFFSGTAIVGFILPWFILAPSEREFIREWTAARIARVSNGPSAHDF
jgi:O-antigen/teichoic acid export membrane protein